MPNSDSSFYGDALSRREWLRRATGLAATMLVTRSRNVVAAPTRMAMIAITLDLEMSAQYPRREIVEWNYEKGNLDEATKRYAVEAAKIVKEFGAVLHFFCVGRVLEQPNVDWLKQLAANGHPIGNHTYDHVHMKATKPQDLQFRFARAPWLVEGLTAAEIIERNIRITTTALKTRAGIDVNGFRTPGGFGNGLSDRPDLQTMLLDQGFKWVSSKYPSHPTGMMSQPPSEEVLDAIVKAQAEAQPFVYPTGLVEVPMSPISDVGAFRSARWPIESFLLAIRRGVAWAIERRAVFDFLAHPSCLVVEDPEFRTIRLICELVRAASDRAEIVSLDRIAAAVKS
jgi:peptidoglycan/xylan/chitin deacetylase (PgdA/CDA1 family)